MEVLLALCLCYGCPSILKYRWCASTVCRSRGRALVAVALAGSAEGAVDALVHRGRDGGGPSSCSQYPVLQGTLRADGGR